MKPIKLSIQAFGPFAGTEEIDFTRLGDNPLFLINGPTGAGKSSILDAICFALYGQTTGAEREAAQMRCDHSDMTLLTEVTLEFMLGAKQYRIRRAPTQDRSKSRGEGTTTQQAEAQLWELDGSEQGRLMVSKSVSEANAAIQTLIGLGVDQFRQVMVLPQGKFRELLMADSKERESIFSQLFETHIYKRIENKLKEKASGIRQAVENHQNEIKGILKAADASSEPELAEEQEALNPKLAEAKTIKDQAEEKQKLSQREHDQAHVLNKKFDDLIVKKNELNTKLTKAEEMAAKQTLLDQTAKAQGIYHIYAAQLTEANKLASTRNQHSHAKATLEKTNEQHKVAAALFEKVKSEASDLDSLKEQHTELKRYAMQHIELMQALKELDHKNSQALKSRQALEAKKQEREKLEKELAEQEALVASTVKKLEPFVSEQHALKTFAEKLADRSQLETLRGTLQQTINESTLAEKEVEAKAADLEKAKKHTLLTELAWHSGQAAILAEQLEENQPCLVCGSKEHPSPAKINNKGGMITKTHVDNTRNLENKTFQTWQNAKDVLANLQNQTEILKSKTSDIEQRLGKYATLELEVLLQEQQAAQARVNELAALKIKKEQLVQRIEEIKNIQSKSQLILAELEAHSTRENNAVLEVNITAENLKRQIPEQHRQPEVLEKTLQECVSKIQNLSHNLAKAEEDLKTKKSAFDQAISTEKALLKQLADIEELSVAVNIAWEQALQKSDFETLEAFLSAQLEDTKCETLKTEIEQYRSSLDRLKGVVHQLQEELADKTRPDLAEISTALEQATFSYKAADSIWRELESRSKSLISVQQKLKKAHAESAQLNKQYAVIGTLNDVANGATGNKISLQRFVLSVLLDDVLILASQRLNIMSKGRYQLVRKEERAKGNKASGLELEVEDGDTGKPRSVATLSGGESFMAALALALGLSDVVQSYAGGIKLDALFIDEGFGSLDMESLDAAIRVLMDLQSSGRMIGIISHVTELKEQMANRIDVVISRVGSSIKTISA
tara:strand:+ start:2658 stop:5720 length:3063 start_codon:yes stop_codon:yes gene_type:complete